MNPLIPFAITILVCLPRLTAGIVDTDGRPVYNNGGSYYIVPYGSNGGLGLTQGVESSPCPLFITHEANSPGVPVRMSSYLKILFLPSSSPIRIAFITNNTLCEGWLWGVTTGGDGQSYVTAGFSYFAIERAGKMENTYKIRVFCDEDEKYCGDLGIIKETGLLGVTNDNPLIVQFKNASDPGDDDSLGKSIM